MSSTHGSIGWNSKPWEPNPSYTIWTLGREGRAGLYQIHELPNVVAPPPHWLNYIGTPDVDTTVRQAVELGGKVVASAADVPRVGRMAVLQDPQGAMFAVSARLERARWKEPQIGDFSWHELLTTNWQTAFDFYSKLFGWEKMQAMDMGPQGTYQIFGTGGHQLGGMFNPGRCPPEVLCGCHIFWCAMRVRLLKPPRRSGVRSFRSLARYRAAIWCSPASIVRARCLPRTRRSACPCP